MSNQKVIALVTGASAGIGAEFCRQLADRCDGIIAVARRQERLELLREELAGRTELHPIEADLASIEGLAKAMEALRQLGPLDYLVNNAGFSTFGNFSDQEIQSQRDMVALHIDAPMTLCRAAIPYMRERGAGHIINVSSIGGFLPSKGVAVYGGTKAFLTFFSQSLQAELEGSGIEVQALCPGYTHTEFHSDMEQSGFDKSRIPEAMWTSAEAVVTASLAALGGDDLFIIPGDGNVNLVRTATENQLRELAEV